MTSESYWSAAHSSEQGELAEVPARADVAIIGAGITGLSAALALRKRGASVAVLESERAGFGASSRNGGMVLTGLRLGPDALLRRYGVQRARAMFDASKRAIAELESLIATEGIDCAYARCGHLEVASKPAHAADFARVAQLLQAQFDHRVSLLTREELGQEIGSAAFFGGMLDERSGGLDPARYVGGLATAAVRAGAALCENAAVSEVAPVADGWHVVSARGDVRADRLLLATGAYTGRPFPAMRRRLVPVGSYIIATEPLPSQLADSLIVRNRMLFDSKRLLHYFRLTPDSRMLFGGRAAFFAESPETIAQSARILRDDMVATFPQLRDANVDYVWGGTLDVTFDEMPHVGKLDGMYYAIGYVGHGVALATLCGSLAASAIVDGTLDPTFAGDPPAMLGYNGRPWFLPLVGAWNRMLDAVS